MLLLYALCIRIQRYYFSYFAGPNGDHIVQNEIATLMLTRRCRHIFFFAPRGCLLAATLRAALRHYAATLAIDYGDFCRRRYAAADAVTPLFAATLRLLALLMLRAYYARYHADML